MKLSQRARKRLNREKLSRDVLAIVSHPPMGKSQTKQPGKGLRMYHSRGQFKASVWGRTFILKSQPKP